MNPYLKRGGRFMASLCVLLGTAFALASLGVLVAAVPYMMNYWAPNRSVLTYRWAWRYIEFAILTGMGAFSCGREYRRLRKEERQGVQI